MSEAGQEKRAACTVHMHIPDTTVQQVPGYGGWMGRRRSDGTTDAGRGTTDQKSSSPLDRPLPPLVACCLCCMRVRTTLFSPWAPAHARTAAAVGVVAATRRADCRAAAPARCCMRSILDFSQRKPTLDKFAATVHGLSIVKDDDAAHKGTLAEPIATFVALH